MGERETIKTETTLRKSLDRAYAHANTMGLGFVYGEMGYHRHRLERVVGLVLQHGGGSAARVLDIGCSVGTLLASYAQHNAPRLMGCDLSGEALAMAQRRVPGAMLFQAALPTTPLADGTFDGVFCLEVIGHVPSAERPRALAELTRIVAPGGWLCMGLRVGVPGRDVPEAFVLEHLSRGFHIIGVHYFRYAMIQKWNQRVQIALDQWHAQMDKLSSPRPFSPGEKRHWLLTVTEPTEMRWLRSLLVGIGLGLERMGHGLLRAQWPVRLISGVQRWSRWNAPMTNVVIFCRRKGAVPEGASPSSPMTGDGLPIPPALIGPE